MTHHSWVVNVLWVVHLVKDAVGFSFQQYIIHLLRVYVKNKYIKEALFSLFLSSWWGVLELYGEGFFFLATKDDEFDGITGIETRQYF